jgi:hypothetical protein
MSKRKVISARLYRRELILKEETVDDPSQDVDAKPPRCLWELPEIILYEIAQFCVPHMQRASFLCHTLAVLAKESHRAILAEDSKRASGILWNSVLQGDYGVSSTNNNDCSRRRSCKRLRRSPIDQVRDAHKLMIDNTEIAYYYLWEMSSSKARSTCLTRRNLVSILETYGPRLIYNKVMSSGGTFLVEICRCRNANCNTILQCVKELVEERGAMVNKATNESSNSTLTPLCVAAVRGMPKLVEYLLSKDASTDIKCSGRFRLHTNSKKSVRCDDATPLMFSRTMLAAEKGEGAEDSDLRDLLACISLLERSHT